MNENDGLLFNLECEPEPDDTWRNHAWWICFDQTCKFGCNVEKAQKAAKKTNEGWATEAMLFVAELPKGATFTADDLTDAVGEADSTGATGAIFKAAATAKLIREYGYTNSTRKTSHGRVLRIWERI